MSGQRKTLIEKLVKTGHLNMPERLALGTTPVSVSEITEVVTRVLEDTGTFPENVKPWVEGQIGHEGAILQRVSEREIRLIHQRSHPLMPTVLGGEKVIDFAETHAAVEAFIKSEWPKDIGGVLIAWGS